VLLVDEPATSIVEGVIFDVVIIAHPDTNPDPDPDPEAVTSDEEETADSHPPDGLVLLEDSKVDS
jgi:hypothetical protein